MADVFLILQGINPTHDILRKLVHKIFYLGEVHVREDEGDDDKGDTEHVGNGLPSIVTVVVAMMAITHPLGGAQWARDHVKDEEEHNHRNPQWHARNHPTEDGARGKQ